MYNVYEDFKYRGLINAFSNEDKIKQMLDTKQVIYCGFDPSASSIHMGNFATVATLMRLQRAGHKIIVLVGGGTGMIGDPGGRSSERNLLDSQTVYQNTVAIKNQLSKFIDLDHKDVGEIVNNFEWLSKMTFLDILRDYGKHFTINYMLAKDTVARRLETGISYTEFSYMILQSIDFLLLHDKYGVSMQFGGSDQWGNLTAGLELIRKVKGTNEDVEVLTGNLLTDSEGKKFGKSVDGALFIDKDKFPPYKLYQYFLNVGDEDAYRYLKVFSFLTKEEIEEVYKTHMLAKEKRHAQKILANEIITMIHGIEELEAVIKMSEALFSGDVSKLSEKQINDLFAQSIIEIDNNQTLVDVLINLKAASSKREAREFISGNSIALNGEKVNNLELLINKDNTLHKKYVIIRRGKKNYYVGKIK